MYTRETEIRHLSSADIYKLAQILEQNNSWKKLMQIIPKDCHSKSPVDVKVNYKYNNDHMRLLENACMKQNRTATEILLDEWGTSGKKRPTLGILLELLVKAELIRAADFVAINYLNEPPPARPSTGPARQIDISLPLDSEFINDVESMLNDSNFPGTETLNDNARFSQMADNNIDFYGKYHQNQKRLDIPPLNNDLNCQSQPTADNAIQTSESSTDEHQAQRVHSDVMKFSSQITTDTEVIPVLSEFLTHHTASEANVTQATIGESMEIPLLSALNTQEPSIEMLPNISALNVEGIELDDGKLKPPEETASMRSSSSASSLSSSSAEDDDLSAPNLSILDQRSSNNDSSLTNVTGTSEENSLETSMNEGSASNDNIPCLSAFK